MAKKRNELTTQEAATRLGISLQAVQYQCRNKRIPCRIEGEGHHRVYYIRESDLSAYHERKQTERRGRKVTQKEAAQ